MKDSSPSYAEDTSKLTLWASKCGSGLFIDLNIVANKLFVVFRVNTYINILQSVKNSLQSISAHNKT